MYENVYSKQDLTYKFIIKKLNIRFHRYLGYEGENLTFNNVELIPLANDNKYMDISYSVDDEVSVNIEHQSSPVYESKMNDIYKYHIYLESDNRKPVISCIVSTYNPNQGCRECNIDYNIVIRPDFFFIKNKNAKEILNNIKSKVKNNIPLTDNEAIDLILVPDMNHNLNINELFEITTKLLKKVIISDNQFYLDLIDCHKKMLKRFFNNDEYGRFEKMLNIKAEDYGFEPNVTGFEEAVALSYIDGKEEGREEGRNEGRVEGRVEGRKEGREEGRVESNYEIACKLLEMGLDEDLIFKATGLTIDDIK